MSLVNNLLKFQMAILQIHCYFLLKKCENPLHCKGFSHFVKKKKKRKKKVYLLLILIYLRLNDSVKLTDFEQLGPYRLLQGSTDIEAPAEECVCLRRTETCC